VTLKLSVEVRDGQDSSSLCDLNNIISNNNTPGCGAAMLDVLASSCCTTAVSGGCWRGPKTVWHAFCATSKVHMLLEHKRMWQSSVRPASAIPNWIEMLDVLGHHGCFFLLPGYQHDLIWPCGCAPNLWLIYI